MTDIYFNTGLVMLLIMILGAVAIGVIIGINATFSWLANNADSAYLHHNVVMLNHHHKQYELYVTDLKCTKKDRKERKNDR